MCYAGRRAYLGYFWWQRSFPVSASTKNVTFRHYDVPVPRENTFQNDSDNYGYDWPPNRRNMGGGFSRVLRCFVWTCSNWSSYVLYVQKNALICTEIYNLWRQLRIAGMSSIPFPKDMVMVRFPDTFKNMSREPFWRPYSTEFHHWNGGEGPCLGRTNLINVL